MVYLIIGYIFLFIFRPFEVWPVLSELHIERIYAIFTLVVFVFSKKNTGVTRPLHYLLLVLSSLIALSPFYSPYAAETAWISEEYPKYLFFYVMLMFGITNREGLEKVLLGYLVVMFVYEAKSLWEFIINDRHVFRMGIHRMVGIDTAFSDPNTFSASIVYALPIAAMFWRNPKTLYSRRYIRLLIVLLVSLSVICVLLTGSRSGLVSLFLFTIIFWLRGNKKLIGAVFTAVLIAVTLQILPQELKGRFESIWSPGATDRTAEESAEGRRLGLIDGYRLFQKRPYFGYGAGTFAAARAEVESEVVGLESHNLYGQVLGDLGLVGAILLASISFSIWRYGRRLIAATDNEDSATLLFYRLLGNACVEVLILLLFQGNFGHNLYRYNWLWISSFLMLGLHFLYMEKRTRPKQN